MKKIPKTNKRPAGKHPPCKYCGRLLRSYWSLNWPASNREPISQTWEGYGRLGNGFFCNLRCGYHFAVMVMRRIEEGRAGYESQTK